MVLRPKSMLFLAEHYRDVSMKSKLQCCLTLSNKSQFRIFCAQQLMPGPVLKTVAVFWGVIGHVLNDDLKRKSFALACRFFPGKHTYDRIAKLLTDIHDEYNIPVEKIVCCVTDKLNGSNFVKIYTKFLEGLFKEFGVDFQSLHHDDSNDEEDETPNSGDIEDDIQDVDMDNVMTLQEPQVLADSEDSIEETLILPPHQRCASHTLNLIGINSPIAAAKNNSKYRTLSHSSNGKCSAIWNKVNSPQSNEKIQEVLGCQIVTPVATRWNSFYDARRSLLVHSPAKLDQLCTSLQLPTFKDVDILFMKEEAEVFSHLAQGLDRLQGDKNPESYMGFLFPTLMQLRHTYRQLSHSNGLKYCLPLASAILVDIETRFVNYYTFSETSQTAALAAITHPAFKLRWLSGDNVDQMKKLFLNTLRLSAGRLVTGNTASASSYVDEGLDSRTLDFFSFMDNVEVQPTTLQSQAELQGLQYLEDSDRTLSSLSRYPVIRKLFRQCNVALPSSAAVERLFSVAGMICTAKRNRLKPQLFEKLLLQRQNLYAM